MLFDYPYWHTSVEVAGLSHLFKSYFELEISRAEDELLRSLV